MNRSQALWLATCAVVVVVIIVGFGKVMHVVSRLQQLDSALSRVESLEGEVAKISGVVEGLKARLDKLKPWRELPLEPEE